jgi:hypothetical protein
VAGLRSPSSTAIVEQRDAAIAAAVTRSKTPMTFHQLLAAMPAEKWASVQGPAAGAVERADAPAGEEGAHADRWRWRLGGRVTDG